MLDLCTKLNTREDMSIRKCSCLKVYISKGANGIEFREGESRPLIEEVSHQTCKFVFKSPNGMFYFQLELLTQSYSDLI